MITKLALLLAFAAGAVLSQDAPVFEPGNLPAMWQSGGPNCLEQPDWQIHQFNKDLFILRESGCSNYEKPFLYLIFGKDRVLLEDTGAGHTAIDKVVDRLITAWAAREGQPKPRLIVAHSHSHGDHHQGDALFEAIPGVEMVKLQLEAVKQAFQISNWPSQPGRFDLGQRVLDVIAIPGHDTMDIAFYDARTGILFTGDTLYPGRLYVRDWQQYKLSVDRLVAFSASHPVAYILGTHIEQSRTPFLDYKIETRYQPDEHPLELYRGDLLELQDALRKAGDTPRRIYLANFTVWPHH